MKKFYAGLAVGLLLLGTAGGATAAMGSYTITDLGTLGGGKALPVTSTTPVR